MLRVSIPTCQKMEVNGDTFTAYKVDVFQSGRSHSLYKRYSEFEELHKQLKKVVDTPEFPPKKVLKFSHKVVEQRRVALELYLQGILESETIPRSFFKFLEVHLPRSGSFDSLDVGMTEPTVTHIPVVGFSKDAFLQENYRSILPDIVVQGVREGLYSNDTYDIQGLVQ
ncbi:sorting nexin-24-like [Mya arenaria]|uniref:sorting nexin-24-like n=1 Tax=Mya arenaria TaxID=6604 RepID=UPI0022E4B46A|nr:sorting nexin-24-like [Mya arenaria]